MRPSLCLNDKDTVGLSLACCKTVFAWLARLPEATVASFTTTIIGDAVEWLERLGAGMEVPLSVDTLCLLVGEVFRSFPPPLTRAAMLPFALRLLTCDSQVVRSTASLSLLNPLLGHPEMSTDAYHALVPTLAIMFASGGELRRDGYSILCQTVNVPTPVTGTPLFWRSVHDGLQDGDPYIRKRALFLLREGLFGLGFGVLGATSTTSQLPVVWEVFISLLESLEDFPFHLVDEVWPHHELLFPDAFCGDGPSDTFVPAVDTVCFTWSKIVLQRAFCNPSTRVKKTFLTSFLSLRKFLESRSLPVGLSVPVGFVIGHVLPAIDDAQLFKTSVDSFRLLVAQYLAGYMDAIDDDGKCAFVRQFLAYACQGTRCQPALQAMLPAFQTALQDAVHPTKPLPAMTPADCDNYRQCIESVCALYLPMSQKRMLPSLLAVLLRFASPATLGLPCVGRCLASFPQEFVLQSKWLPSVQAWLQSGVAVSTISDDMQRFGDGVEPAMPAQHLALILALYGWNEDLHFCVVTRLLPVMKVGSTGFAAQD
jgi:hypothetical protein